MDRTLLLFRTLFLTACGVGGWFLSEINPDWQHSRWFGAFLALALGLLVVLADLMMKGVSLRAFSSATFGLALGCVLATLVWASDLFNYASKETQWVIHLAVYLTFGYLGTMLALRSNRDEFSLLIPYIRFIRQQPHEQVNLVDTSAIIDGRIGDLCSSGFVDGTLVIPRFVLDELQGLADSSDASRRTRGRHGLDLLKNLQEHQQVEVKIHETTPSTEPVDSRLTRLARILDARLITTDYNLGRVAELQKVRVLNIHLLAGTLRSSMVAGENVRIKLIREGKESHQAVGFLPDGTMIVVNHGRTLIGHDVEVAVTGTIQTTAGRMVFADLRKETPSA